ncbi:motility associated factor glycosyltransferase family protein [Neomoorella thermoacetica]|uniref:motility associated factor glycosyltransferase family protein n=1 Tax=Neomoorella thermoacetica TaxID=1525 RepID=UPI0008FA6FBC|nr:6-hydroxymethylpterin diphosphokinase MptE-like protein [Moorella thermoacetica]OIQ12535.1 hypothetical protein MOOTH_05340 [Moorella thermoacetica]
MKKVLPLIRLDNSELLNFQVVPAKSGDPTLVYREDAGCSVYLHSKYDPLAEGEEFARGRDISPGDRVLLYGLGLGYHARAILQRVGQAGRVTVVEGNRAVIYFALKKGLLSELLNSPNFKLVYSEDEAGLKNRLIEELEDIISLVEAGQGKFIIHDPSLRVLPPSLAKIKELLKECKVAADSTAGATQVMAWNFACNKDLCTAIPGIEALFGRFTGVPLFLIAAGPSLTEALPFLKIIGEKALLFAVGTAVKPLLNYGIEPHMAIIVDPYKAVAAQLAGVEASFPLVFLPTACAEAVVGYKGPKIAAFQAGHPGVEELARHLNKPLLETGGSVATAALEIALNMGANPVIFVGQDLAYMNGRSHAQGTIHERTPFPVHISIKVAGNTGEDVITATSWNICRRWLERRIAREGGRRFINTSLRGARINGTEVMPVEEAVARFCRRELPLRATLSHLLTYR